MKKEIKFYRCIHCHNIIVKLKDSKVAVVCCGEEMQELIPGVEDAALEKHVPYVKKKENEIIVKIGEVEHPMLSEHYIEWIALVTDNNWNIKFLAPGEKPLVTFPLEKHCIIYEYCNLHGLWKKEL